MRKILVILCLLILPFETVLTGQLPGSEKSTALPLIKIGVLAFRGKARAVKRWTPTADYLSKKIPGYQFQILPLNLTEISQAIAAQQIQFALTNPGNYVVLENRFGISRIATLQTLRRGKLSTSFGSVIISLADNPQIKTLADLQGKSFMAVSHNAFGGFQLAWRELAEQGIDPFSDFKSLEFVGFPQDDIVYALRDHKVDAATVRADILLRLVDEGKVKFTDYRILNPRKSSNDIYPLSTRLYPEWPFSRLKNTPYELSTQVAVALFTMPSNHPAAQVSRTAGWTIPLDYSPVYDLMRSLQIGPYEVLRQSSVTALIKKYALWLLMAGLFLTTLIIFNFYASHANRKLRKIEAALREEITQRKNSQQALARYKDTLQEKVLERTRELNQTNLSLRKSQVALQQLADITMTPLLSHDEKLMKLLEAGREYYRLPVAVLSSLEDSKKTQLCKVSGQLDSETELAGPLHEQCIVQVVAQMGEPLDIPDLHTSNDNCSSSSIQPGSLSNYLAAAILVDNRVHCILEFGGTEARQQAYSHWDHNILRLMAQWIGSELERKYADEEKQQHQIELARVSRMSAMGEMAASLAHELNQPLTGAINYGSGCIRMLKEGEFDVCKLMTGLERSVEGVTLAAEIIRQLREFVQKGESKRTCINLNNALTNVMELMKPELHRHQISVKMELDKSIDTVLANLIQIEQVILNFIRNAIDAMENISKDKRQIFICTQQGDGHVSVIVKDSGEGIPEDKLECIFDAFYTSKAEGMGMGLSISRSIIESSNGLISARNLAQGGCIFTFELPVFNEAIVDEIVDNDLILTGHTPDKTAVN